MPVQIPSSFNESVMHRSSPCPTSYPRNTCTENISNTIGASTFSRHRFDKPESPRSIDPPNRAYFLRRSSDDNCPLPGRKSMLVPKCHHPGTRGEVRKEGERRQREGELRVHGVFALEPPGTEEGLESRGFTSVSSGRCMEIRGSLLQPAAGR